MALLRFKRSAVPAKVPSIADLALGEFAINTFDGKVYTKKNDGTESIIEIGGAGGGGTVTSVAASGGTTGLTFSGSPITTSGTLTLGGTLAVANGGTGATTAAIARSNLSAAVLGANNDITSMTAITGGISSPDFLQFDTTAVVTPATGRLFFNDGEGGLAYTLKGGNVVQEVGQSQQVLVYNGTGAALTKGQVVYSNGAQGQRPTVALALATGDATSARTLGIVAEAIANGAEGWVTSLGIIENINTSAFTAGAQLYLSGSTAGGLTATKPVAPLHMVYVARCIKSHATSGRMFVTVQNGYELDELHDVAAVSPSNGQTIVFNSTTSLWEKNTVSLTAGVNGTLPIANGGTGSTTAAAALTALGAYPAANPNGYTSNTGTVTGVTGTAPIVSSGGTAPAISISAATTSAAGSMSSADKTKLDGIAAGANNYVLPKATATALGGVEVFDATVQTVAANAVTTTASRTYGVQLNAADQMVVNVPWSNSGGTVTSVSGTGTVSGLTLTGNVTTSGSLTLGGTLSLTSGNVTTALGFTPYNATNPSGYITSSGSITGNAATATALQTARTINGVLFNGTANITVADATKLPLAGGTMTGAIAFAGAQTWPTFNQNTTGTASNVTGTVAIANGGTGSTTAGAALTALGAYPATNPNGYTSNTGTVTSVATGTGLTGGPITSSGTVALANTAVTAGSYTNANITVDAQGRLTAASSGSGGSTAVSYPQNIQSGNYTLVLADSGKHIYSANTGAQTITIPTNASVEFPIGTLVTIVNMGSNKIVLSISGVSIIPAGSITSLASAQIPSGATVQLLKTGTNIWNATFGTVATNSIAASYLVIAGGASGGRSNGGGGGAGGYLTSTTSLSSGTTYTVTVGAGGASASGTQQGNDGSNSVLSGTGVSVTAIGGGGGGTQNGTNAGRNGGSGGGGSYLNGVGGTPTSGQGFSGGTGSTSTGNGAGGGGASAVGIGSDAGTNPCKGGDGLASSITGTSVTRAGGGGGGGLDRFGAGGAGGGGNGARTSGAVSGTANTGGGGGGGSSGLGTNSGAGGSGVVILSIPTADYTGVTTGSPTVTTSGSNTILTFTSSGSYTA